MNSTYRSGVIFGLIAYGWWGLVPLYFIQVKHAGSETILAHRIVWTVVIVAILSVVFGLWRDLLKVLASPRLVLTMFLSAALLTLNWLLYIYASTHDKVAEASLGYYMMPLVNAFLATVFLGEKLRPAHYPALLLVAGGVAIPFVAAGDITWVAIALPVTFAVYGLVRRQVAVESFTGLAVESLLLMPFAVGFVIWQGVYGESEFGRDFELSAWLIFSGVVTLVPLLTYTMSLRRMPLMANSFLQFLSPSVQFLLAVFVLHEVMPPERWAAIVCVWISVAIFLTDAMIQMRSKRRQRNAPDVTPAIRVNHEPEPLPASSRI